MKKADQRQGALSIDIKSKSAKPYKTSKKHAWPLRRSLKILPEVLILEIIPQLDKQLVPNQKPCHVSQRIPTASSPHIKMPTTLPSRPRLPSRIPIDFRTLLRSKPSIGNKKTPDVSTPQLKNCPRALPRQTSQEPWSDRKPSLDKPNPDRTSPVSFKLICSPDPAPTLDCSWQSEMCSYFESLIDGVFSNVNQKAIPTSTHQYFWAKLWNAISVKTFYNSGADLSCISSQTFHALFPDQWLICQPVLSPSCQGDNRRTSTHRLLDSSFLSSSNDQYLNETFYSS